MATLWDVITANSTLPVEVGNTFWDHMNSQASGMSGGRADLTVALSSESLDLQDDVAGVVLHDDEAGIALSTDKKGIEL